MRTLLEGLYVSRYDIIYNVVEENSSIGMRLPEEYWPDFTVHLLGLRPVRETLDRYEVNGDFLSRETHQPMLIELLGDKACPEPRCQRARGADSRGDCRATQVCRVRWVEVYSQ